jgi:hypothetical protein
MASSKPKKDWESSEMLNRIYELASLEHSQESIAKNINCATSTFKRKLALKGPVWDAFKKGRAHAPSAMRPIVLSHLQKQMEGYSVTEKKVTRKKDASGKVVYTNEEIHTKHIPANVTATIFYSKARLGISENQDSEGESDTKLKIIRTIVNSKEDLVKGKDEP